MNTRALSLSGFNRLFPSEDAARLWFEACRWPNGPQCYHCGSENEATYMVDRKFWHCKVCRGQFSVCAGTPMHRTHLPLLKWAQAIYLLVSSSKGISSRTISELIDVSYSTAWHLTHRIRAMMAENTLLLDGIVEVDEMFAGAPPRKLRPSKGKTGRGTDRPLLLVAAERDGNVVTCQIPTHSKDVIGEALDGVLGDQAVIMTDGLPAYIHLGEKHTHLSVLHSAKEYARTDEATGHRVHVNRVESFNNFFRRAILGVWHQISTKHLSRYASETAFWWNHKDISCLGRMEFLVTNGVGRVLTYAFLTEDGKIRVRPLA